MERLPPPLHFVRMLKNKRSAARCTCNMTCFGADLLADAGYVCLDLVLVLQLCPSSRVSAMDAHSMQAAQQCQPDCPY